MPGVGEPLFAEKQQQTATAHKHLCGCCRVSAFLIAAFSLSDTSTFSTTTMATYPVGIPTLNGLDSGLNDDPAPGINAGDALNDQHVVAAANQHKNRKKLSEMSIANVTDQELLDSKRRKHLVQTANFDGPTPIWAQQLQQQSQNLQQQSQNLQQLLQQHIQQTQQFQQQIQWKITQESERNMNRSRRSTSNPIQPVIRVADGQYPGQNAVYFPQDQNALENATVAELSALLQFYGVAAHGTRSVLIDTLKSFLGVTL